MSSEDDLRAQLAEALSERNRLWAELNRRAALEREVEDCHAELDETLASASWRVTAPLRRAGAIARRVRRALKP
jgi:hypothetical protein